jgi:hypothetical protein
MSIVALNVAVEAAPLGEYALSMAKKKPLTAADKEGARLLRKVFKASGKTRAEVIEAYGETSRGTKLSVGMFSQYLHGHTRIGPYACMKLASALGCLPTDIRPDFQSLPIQAVDLPPDVLRLALDIAMFNKTIRDDIAQTVDDIKRNGASYLNLLRKLTRETPVST